MKAILELNPIGPNQTEIILPNDNRIFFSYTTPVAAYVVGRGYLKTEHFYSVTTSRHINQWIDGAKVTIVSQDDIESLLECHKMFND